MEFPAHGVTVERLLTGAIVAIVLSVARLESRSQIAADLRAPRPWTLWLAFEAAPQPPKLFLALMRPERRTAELVYIPDATPGADGRPLSAAREDALGNDADPAGAAKDEADAARELLAPLIGEVADSDLFVYAETSPSEEPDEALTGARDFSRLSFKLLFARSGLRTNLGRIDRALSALELLRLGRDDVRPAWLPADVNERRAVLGRLAAGLPLPVPNPLTVEVLNAAGKRGIALEATKVLRLGGADVLSSGNAAKEQAVTVVYDRTGDIDAALAVRHMLGCRAARAVSQADAKRRIVDVTVLLAEDCAAQR